MTQQEALEAADRAANAAGRCRPKEGGWLAECGCRVDLVEAARFVRGHVLAPAEAVYLHLRRDQGIAWGDLEARKRVAVEVFRGCLVVLDRLVEAPIATVARPASDWLGEGIGERDPGIDDKEVLR